MEIAGKLMDKGIDTTEIIDGSFYRKTYAQNQMLGKALLGSALLLDGKCVFSSVTKQEMDAYGVTTQDLDGIIDQLRLTEGVETAVFMYETGENTFKVSMRSCKYVDVSRIAACFGGGGHAQACGFKMDNERLLDLLSGELKADRAATYEFVPAPLLEFDEEGKWIKPKKA